MDVPIYRVSESRYRSWLDTRLSAERKSVSDTWDSLGQRAPSELVARMENHTFSKIGAWQFNEIIGYLRLHFIGNQVRGEHFSAETARTQIGKRKKIFRMVSLKMAWEMNIPSGASNEEILQAIAVYVERCRAELGPGRVFDLRQLEMLGPHIDWIALRKSTQGVSS